MKNLYKYFILIVLVGVFGCEELIEPVDENVLDADRLDFDPAFAEGVLMNAYVGLINQYQSTEVATDDAVTNDINSGFRQMAVGQWAAQFNPVSRWDKYEPIFYVNRFISTIENVQWKRDPETNELFELRLRGEALAMRAVHHMYVLQGHAGESQSGELLGIPYYTEFIDPAGDFNVPRLSFEESVAKINVDFEEALSLLPMDYDNAADIPTRYESYDPEAYRFVFGDNNRLRISGRIIKAYQAKLALLAASPAFMNGQGDYYQQAADLAAELINDIGGVAGLDPNGLAFYDENSDRDLAEVLWRNSVGTSAWFEENQFPPSLNGDGRINPSQNLVDAFPMLNGYPIADPNSGYDANNPYEERDPRLAQYILYNGNTIGDNTIFTGAGAGIDQLDAILGLSTRTGYYLKKLLRPDVVINNDGSVTEQEHFNVFLRYTDLFLVLAEAANE
ncbi:MAG: RagB/SusD family nutrient uptake outer membrane protein, partial [Bacteroidota bacterium]